MRISVAAGGLFALCAAATHAQASGDSLTVYGGVDGNITYATAGDKGHQWQLRDGGLYVSRLGFMGYEDLGGGWRTGFVLESQSNSDTGTGVQTNTTNQPTGVTTGGGLTWVRKATVSLYTPLGELRAGRDYSTTFVPTTYFDPFFSAGVGAAAGLQAFYTPTLPLPTLVRVSNMASFIMPSHWFPGVFAYGQFAPGEGSGARYEGLGAGYRGDKLLTTAAVGRTKNPLGGTPGLSPATVSADNTLDVWSLGISYNFSGLRLMGFYHSQTLASFGTTAANTETDREVADALIGFAWTLDLHVVKFSYMVRNDKGRADNDARMLALGYAYNVSKRTALYVNAANFDNRNTATYNFLTSGFTPPPGQTGRGIQAGLSHNF
ncbi:porin [Sphaerotilaceae bacterium SBD11-9]